MLNGLLVTLLIMICIALVAVVLLQRSEGGALGAGGGPTGLITTRGAGDLLTRTTWILFTMFLLISMTLTLLSGREHSNEAILKGLKSQSINPDQLPPPPAAPFVPGGAAPAAAPGAPAPNAAAAALAPPSAAAGPQSIQVQAHAPASAQAAALKPPIPIVRSAAPRAAPKPAAAAPAASIAPAPVVISAPPPAPRVEHAPATVVAPPPPPAKIDSDAPVKTTTP